MVPLTMRVAIDARYVREKPSGIGAYVQALVDRVPRAAPADHFRLWTHPLAERPISRAPNVEEIVVRPGPNSPLTLGRPRRYASFDDVDVFHSPHNLLPRGVPCATVVTVQDVMEIDRPDLHLQGVERFVKNFYYPQAVWRALRSASQLIVTSAATADRVRTVAPEAASRLHVIWLAPGDLFRPAADLDAVRTRASALVGSDAPFLLVVGQNSAAKRHADAISAFAAGAPRQWRMVLLQRQGASSRLARLAHSLHIADRVVWLPSVGEREVVMLMQAAVALVQPSLYEGFGLPVVEAMACGCPVVASDIAPIREIAGGAAILAPPGDATRLAAAIRDLAGSSERRRALVEQGLERARAFSWDRCARETLEVYRRAFG
jgi:glycosyltransferase involved in cell wall biosynthesis